ncbi:MAG: hypothetical protein J0M04_00150 [Verrucomicrobia bacterium]|nr:hypothetical protein [Verrucomicrobiota bacterium]
MNKSPFALPLAVVLLSASGLLALGQQPAQPGQPTPGRRPPAAPFAETQQKPETLSTNYRIIFSGRSGEDAIGELSALTCSKSILISGPLNSSDTPTTFNISGTLEEMDGLLILNYSVSYTVAVVTSTGPTPPGQPTPPAGYRAVQYREHSSKGTLKMKPGQTYDFLVTGGNTYSIVVRPEVDKAQAK